MPTAAVLKVLVVDDQTSVRAMTRMTLEMIGVRLIHEAENGRAAMDTASLQPLDLIISDYRMPGLTGLEFLSLLRQEGYETPLIMLTGYGSIEHAVAAIKAGAIDYITKPVRPEQLELDGRIADAPQETPQEVRLDRCSAASGLPALPAPDVYSHREYRWR